MRGLVFAICFNLLLYGEVEIPASLFSPKMRSLKGELVQRPYITAVSCGEVGNACFRSATGVAYALDYKYCFAVNVKDKERYPAFFSRFPCVKIRGRRKEVELPMFFDRHPQIDKSILITGFPNSTKYFSRHRKVIQKLFAPSKQLQKQIEDKYDYILSAKEKYVALHMRTLVRAWDRENIWDREEATGRHFLLHRGVTPGYYKKAFDIFDRDEKFIVFTDNIEVAKKYVAFFDREFIFLENSTMEEDFYLISMMDKVILSDSTFSVFAAYIDKNPNKKVIMPERVYNSCLEVDDPNWIRLDRANTTEFEQEVFRQWSKIGCEFAQRL